MTGRIRCVGAQAANDVQQLETVWDTMRQFAAIHKMIHIGSIQVSAEGMDMLFPPLSALQNSKTGVQTTLDLAIFGGAWMQPTEDIEYQRGISTPKNKLKRAGKKSYLKAETFFNPDLNTWK
ncbi:putative DNA helicase [Acinetobacter phage AB3]|nr:putative DNA helicase [Acinetobacter phage AB3]AGC35328.1 putative DNA helicase [Acinetobacter phage AB3]